MQFIKKFLKNKKFWLKYFKDYLKFKSSDLYGLQEVQVMIIIILSEEKKIFMFRRTEFPWNTYS